MSDLSAELEDMTRAIIEVSGKVEGLRMRHGMLNLGMVKGYLISSGAPAQIMQALDAVIADARAAVPAPGAQAAAETHKPEPESQEPEPETQEPEGEAEPPESEPGPPASIPAEPEPARTAVTSPKPAAPDWRREKLLEMKIKQCREDAIAEAIGTTKESVSVMWTKMRKTDPRAAAVPRVRRGRAPVARAAPKPPAAKPEPAPSRPAVPAWRRPSYPEADKARFLELRAKGKTIPEVTRIMKKPTSYVMGLNQDILNTTVPPGETLTYFDEQGRKITRLPPGYAKGITPGQTVMPSSGG